MRMIKKILFVTTISGFVPQFEMNDVKIMQDMGYEVHYASNFTKQVYSFDQQKLVDQGIKLHSIDIEKSPLNLHAAMKAIRQIREIIENEQISIVHCHNPMGGVCARIAAYRSRINTYIIYTAHGLHFYKGAPLVNWLLYYPVEKLMAHMTDVIITINREDYINVKEHFSLKKNGHVEHIHGVGVDMDRFKPMREISEKMRYELQVPPGAFHIVTAAELNENKNQQVIIEAIAALQRDDIYYSICGVGPMKEKLEKLIEDKGLTYKVRLLGFCSDMDKVLQTADVFAFPSLREGLGIAAIEALACGVPVIAFKNRGTSEYIIDGVNGIMCDRNDADMFKEAILKMYSDKTYRRSCAENSRASVRRFADVEVIAVMQRIYGEADKMIS